MNDFDEEISMSNKDAYGLKPGSKESIAVHFVVACGNKGADMHEIESHVFSIIRPIAEQDSYYSVLKRMRNEGWSVKSGSRFYGRDLGVVDEGFAAD